MPTALATPLQANAVLETLSTRDLALLAPDLVPCLFHGGKSLYSQGEAVPHVHFPKSGILALVLSSQVGVEVDVAMIGRENALGLCEALGGHPSMARAQVHCDGSGWRISASALRQAVAYSPTLSKALWGAAHLLQQQVMQSVLCHRLHSLDQRLARSLLMCQDRTQSSALDLTHDILRQILGTRRVSVTVACGELRKAGLIRYSRGEVEILDRLGLEARACECYCAIKAQNPALDGTGGLEP